MTFRALPTKKVHRSHSQRNAHGTSQKSSFFEKDFERYLSAVRYVESLSNIVHTPTTPKQLPNGVLDFTGVGLKRADYLYTLLGNPQKHLRVIHIGGTSGKGTTSMFTQHILMNAGLRVGLYISPFLTTTAERIRVNNSFISAREFADLVDQIRPFIDKMYTSGPYGAPSYFEVMLALAYMYFKNKKVDVVVLEVGCGGTIDATNACTSLVTVVTNVTKAHTRLLGKTVRQIAKDKSGIIKRSNDGFVSATTSPLVKRILRDRCSEYRVPFHFADPKRITYPKQNEYPKGNAKDSRNIFSYTSSNGVQYKNLELQLQGDYQAVNATCAIEAVEIFSKSNQLSSRLLTRLSARTLQRSIRNGLHSTRFAGRMEMMQSRPRILLDAAHNNAKARAFAKALRANFTYRKLILVLGITSPEEKRNVLRWLVPLAGSLIFTRPSITFREVQEPKTLQKIAKDILRFFPRARSPKITIKLDPLDALDEAQRQACKNDLICVTGSIFLIGNVRERWFSEKDIMRTRSNMYSEGV